MSVVNAKHLSDVISLGQSKLVAYIVFSSKLDKQIIMINETYEELEKESMEIDNLNKSQERQEFIKAARMIDIIGCVDELKVMLWVIYSSTLGRNILISESLWIALEHQHNIVNYLIINDCDTAFSL